MNDFSLSERSSPPNRQTGLGPTARRSAPVVDRSTVDLHIGELVFHGVAAGDPDRIARATERELARLLTDRGLPSLPASGTHAVLEGGTIEVVPGASSEVIGVRLARAILEGLSR